MITHVTIENFKSIKNISIDLGQINILIGANGSGKSNFISFFKFVNSIYDQELKKYFIEHHADSIFYYGRKKSEYIYGKLFFDDINSYVFCIKPKDNEEVYIEKEGKGYQAFIESDDVNYFYDYNLLESRLKQGEYYRDSFIRKHMEELQIFHFHDTSSVSSLRKDSHIDDNQYLKYDGRNIAAFLYYLKEEEPISFKRIQSSVESIAPFFKDFVLLPNPRNPNRISLRWRHKEDLEGFFEVSQLSDGTLRFIALATLLLQPNPPKIIIIDEPELGLHPFAINKLAGFIKSVSAKSQVIISTQSSELISNFQPENIFITELDPTEKQSIIYQLSSEDLDTWLSDYTLGDLWKYNKLGFGQPFI